VPSFSLIFRSSQNETESQTEPLGKRSISFAGCFNIYNGNYHSVFLGVFYSLTDWNGVDMKINFVGFKNYKTIFSSHTFIHSFLITVEFTLINVVLVNIVSFVYP